MRLSVDQFHDSWTPTDSFDWHQDDQRNGSRGSNEIHRNVPRGDTGAICEMADEVRGKDAYTIIN